MDMLLHPKGYLAFAEFLHLEHSEENLRFWSEVQQFRTFAAENKAKKRNGIKRGKSAKEAEAEALQERARKIYHRYIAAGSRMEINLPANITNELFLAFTNEKDKKKPVTKHVFDKAQESVFDTLEKDPYKRFLDSEIYDKLRQTIQEDKKEAQNTQKKKELMSMF